MEVMDIKAEDDDMGSIEKESKQGWRGRERRDRWREKLCKSFHTTKIVTGNPNKGDVDKDVDKED